MTHCFSFSGCGFLGIYHFGVSACLKQHVPKLLEDCKIAGASAGSFVAGCLITGCSIDDCAKYFVELVHKAESKPILGPLHPRFQLIEELRKNIMQVLPADAYKVASGRLFISLTRYKDLENVIVSEYESNTELIEAMLCSSFVPFYCGILPPRYKGNYYWDGGLSDNQPMFNEPTITVSPFSGEVDICPRDNSSNFIHLNLCNSSIQFTQENLHRVSIALFPPNSATLCEIFQQGYDDALLYLQKNEMISCIDHPNLRRRLPSFIKKFNRTDELDIVDTIDGNPEDDFECRGCKQKLRMSLFASLSPHLIQLFHSSKKQGILKYICQGKLFQALSKMVSPFMAPADIMWVYITSLISNIPRRQHELDHILKETYLLFSSFLKNYLCKPCKHNKRLIKTSECKKAANSNNQSSNMDEITLEQVYQDMNIVSGDDNDSSQNSNPLSLNTEVQDKILGYNQETPNQTDSKEFNFSCSCSLCNEADRPTESLVDESHDEVFSDPLRNIFDKELTQSKNNIQINESESMVANNQQINQMNIPNFEKDYTMTDKHFLERSQSDPQCESIHGKESRSTPDRVIQNNRESMGADKRQYLSKCKDHNTCTEQFLLGCINLDQLEVFQSGMEAYKEKHFYIPEKCNIAVNESLVETFADELQVDCEFDTQHNHISDTSQIINCKTVETHSDGLNNDSISFNNGDSDITSKENFLERSPSDRLESSVDVEEICYTKHNAVENDSQKERNGQLSTCDDSNDKKTFNSNISSKYRNVRTLSIQNYAEGKEEIQNGVEAEYNQEINNANNIFTQVKEFLSIF